MAHDCAPGPRPDIVVVGGGVGGCLAAVAAARQQQNVVLIESRPYLGHEFTATLRPWMPRSAMEGISPCLTAVFSPDDESKEIDVDLGALPPWCAQESPLFCGSIKKGLLALLQREGVTVLLMSHVAAVLMQGPTATGVLLANKHGLQALHAPTIIDATGNQHVADLIAPLPDAAAKPRRYTLGFTKAVVPDIPDIPMPKSIGLLGDTIRVHPGKNRSCNLYVEFAFTPAASHRLSLVAQSAGEQQARRLGAEVAAYLIDSTPGFEQAIVAEFADETAPESPSLGHPLDSLPRGLLVAPASVSAATPWENWGELESSAQTLAATATEASETAPTPGIANTSLQFGQVSIPLADCQCSPLNDPGLALDLITVELLDSSPVPLLATCDVLVAGGGTAGACAAIAAAEEGADVVVIDANPDLGGTQTVGLVAGYYYGYCEGFTKELDTRVATVGRELHGGRREGHRRVAKALCYENGVVNGGGRWFGNALICGGLSLNGHVRGILVGSRFGLNRVEATVTMDATGDGDVAALCGAETTFGNPRNGNAQDYSQWGKGTGSWQSKSLDLDVIDQRHMSEMLRGLTIAHQKGLWFDFSPMLTVREGRHVQGEYTLDIRDIFERRRFEDAIAFAKTDWDPHGISSCDLGRLGFLPTHMEQFATQIPFRSCIPKGLSGLIITAKAISATTDAACLCRMAPDVQNLGYATGLAAALTAEAGGDPRTIDLLSLKERLLKEGILPQEEKPRAPERGTPEARVARLAGGDETALLDVVLLPAEDALPRLRDAWQMRDTNRLELGKGLAWYGDPRGSNALVAELERLAEEEDGAAYDDTHPHKAGNPRAGIVDHVDTYWRINQLLTLVARARISAALPPIARIVDQAWSGGEPVRELNVYIKGRIDMQRVPHFDRLLCIAYCAERLADPALIAPLDKLLGRRFVVGNLSSTPAEAGPNYHDAYAEVQLAAAAFRCGSKEGGRRLITYLKDLHSILKLFACAELKAASGVDLGVSPERWSTWLNQQDKLAHVPYRTDTLVF